VQGKEDIAGAACISFTGCKTSGIVIVNLSLRTVNTGQRICYLSGMRSVLVFYISKGVGSGALITDIL
jgi:hypothetical protein